MSKNDTNASESGAQSTPPTVADTPGCDADTSDLTASVRKSVGKTVWTGAAVGIGSAAIVAALLYTRRKS